jgi:hypothetical protein
MKGCLKQSTLQAWLDRELPPQTAAAARTHLSQCNVCAARAREAGEILALVDDAWQAELPAAAPAARLSARVEEALTRSAPVDPPWRQFPPAYRQIAAAAAVLVIVATAAVVVRTNQATLPVQKTASVSPPELPAAPVPAPAASRRATGINKSIENAPPPVRNSRRRPTWIESETNRHLEQTQLLLRSIRNALDKTALDYERERSRELLNRNRLLRRSAELKQGRRAELLSHVEPILLDIANLPEQPASEQMQSIRELIRDQQLIAELQLYTGRNLY